LCGIKIASQGCRGEGFGTIRTNSFQFVPNECRIDKMW
jgi:hypothetical protein